MNPSEIENQNRDELFNELKDKCKPRVKRNLFGFVVWIIALLFLFLTWSKLDSPKDILYFIFWIVVVCSGGWLLLFDYRFLKIFDNLDTPERLLYWFEKKHRYGVIGCLVVGASYIGTILAEPGMDLLDYLAVAIGFIISILLFFYCGFPSWYSKEKDIIEQLRELVDKK